MSESRSEGAEEPNSPEPRVIRSRFITTVMDHRLLPVSELPEAAFFGRSNVGKSSLLNAVCGRRLLAFKSKTPGRTQALNFFEIDFMLDGLVSRGQLVDVPGYGYAKVAPAVRQIWDKLIGRYLRERENLRTVILLIDARREPREEERWIVEQTAGRQMIIGLTKTDKLKKNDRQKSLKQTAASLGISPDVITAVSLLKGREFGVQELRAKILAALGA